MIARYVFYLQIRNTELLFSHAKIYSVTDKYVVGFYIIIAFWVGRPEALWHGVHEAISMALE